VLYVDKMEYEVYPEDEEDAPVQKGKSKAV